jgi:hypothetical protein
MLCFNRRNNNRNVVNKSERNKFERKMKAGKLSMPSHEIKRDFFSFFYLILSFPEFVSAVMNEGACGFSSFCVHTKIIGL